MPSDMAKLTFNADIEEAVDRFERAWQLGERPTIRDHYLETVPWANALLQELVLIDLEYCLRGGNLRGAEDYLREFPQLQTDEQAIRNLLQVESRWRKSMPFGKDCAHALGNRSSGGNANHPSQAIVVRELNGEANGRMSANAFVQQRESAKGQDLIQETQIVSDLSLNGSGKFRLIETVGRGSFGTVYQAIDTQLSRLVAIKLPRQGILESEAERERFFREARSAASLNHPHIVPVYEVGGTREQPFIVSAFVNGNTLAALLAVRRFEFREVSEIVSVVANALQYAHERLVVHRDVKPSNIMLNEHGQPFLMDFGLAKRYGDSLLTVDGQLMGTPAYMSPEQALRGGRFVDARSDIYSLGVVLYELLTGERPFQGDLQALLHQVIHESPRSPIAVDRRVPRDLAMICLKCLHKLPQDRYSTASELREDLLRHLRGESVRARPISLVERGWRWVHGRPKLTALLATGVAMAAGLAVLSTFLTMRVKTAERQSEQSIRRANDVSANAQRLEGESRGRLEKLFVSKGNSLIESGDPVHALPWFAAALMRSSTRDFRESVHRVRLITSMADTPSLAHLWSYSGSIVCVARNPKRPLLAVACTDRTVIVRDLTDVRSPGKVLRHPSVLSQCEFSPDGTRLATSCNDGKIRIWLTSDFAREPRVLTHPSRPCWMSFDPTGRLLATAYRDGTVWLVNVASGTQLSPVLVHHAIINHLAFNADGSQLATAGSDNAVHLWSMDGRKEVATLAHDGPVNRVVFAPNGQSLASASDDRTVRIWNSMTYASEFVLRQGSSALRMAFSPDGSLLAVGCRDGNVRVWDLKSKIAIPSRFFHEESVWHLSFSRDGQMLVTASEDHTARIWDLKNGAADTPFLAHAAPVIWAEFADDQKQLLTGSYDGMIRLWRLSSPFKAELRCPGSGPLLGIQLSPDERWLLLTRERGAAQLCDLKSSRLVAGPLANSSGLCRAAFAPSGHLLVGAHADGTLSLWDISKQPVLSEVRKGIGPLNDIGFSPDGRLLITAGTDGIARILSFSHKTILLALEHGDGLQRALFSRDSRKIYTAGGVRPLCVWDVASGKPLSKLQDLNKINDCHLTPDGRFLLTLRYPKGVTICNASTGAALQTLIHRGAQVSFAVVSPDGSRVMTASQDNTGRVWDVATGRPVMGPVRHRQNVTYCAFSPNGLMVATASSDQTARVWDANTGEAVSPPLRHTDRVLFVAFCAGGKELVSVSADGLVRIWILDDGESTDDLSRRARLTSGQMIDDAGSTIVMRGADCRRAWKRQIDARSSGLR